MAKTSNLKRAERLEDDAAVNRATVASLLQNGASEDYVKDLRDKAEEQEAQAFKLRQPKRKRGE
jgi:hypothetical protein